MFLFRKNIILVPSDYDGISLTKGLLSLDCFDDKTKCTLRCYNLQSEADLLLGVAIGGKLNKIKVEKNQVKNVSFDIENNIKNADNISCVLLNVKQDSYEILLWGSTEINNNWKSTLELMIDDILPKKTNKNAEEGKTDINTECSLKELNEKKEPRSCSEMSLNNVEQTNQQNDVKQNLLDENLNSYIDQVIKMTEEDTDQKQDESQTEQKSLPTFYERLSPQIDKMFSTNDTEQVLEQIIPSSKFCKVNFDDDSGYYVFGIIYDNSQPKYLCYGVPAKKGSEPPKELSNLYQWLPININDESGDGFYMMYQDAESGKNISVEII